MNFLIILNCISATISSCNCNDEVKECEKYCPFTKRSYIKLITDKTQKMNGQKDGKIHNLYKFNNTQYNVCELMNWYTQITNPGYLRNQDLNLFNSLNSDPTVFKSCKGYNERILPRLPLLNKDVIKQPLKNLVPRQNEAKFFNNMFDLKKDVRNDFSRSLKDMEFPNLTLLDQPNPIKPSTTVKTIAVYKTYPIEQIITISRTVSVQNAINPQIQNNQITELKTVASSLNRSTLKNKPISNTKVSTRTITKTETYSISQAKQNTTTSVITISTTLSSETPKSISTTTVYMPLSSEKQSSSKKYSLKTITITKTMPTKVDTSKTDKKEIIEFIKKNTDQHIKKILDKIEKISKLSPSIKYVTTTLSKLYTSTSTRNIFILGESKTETKTIVKTVEKTIPMEYKSDMGISKSRKMNEEPINTKAIPTINENFLAQKDNNKIMSIEQEEDLESTNIIESKLISSNSENTSTITNFKLENEKTEVPEEYQNNSLTTITKMAKKTLTKTHIETIIKTVKTPILKSLMNNVNKYIRKSKSNDLPQKLHTSTVLKIVTSTTSQTMNILHTQIIPKTQYQTITYILPKTTTKTEKLSVTSTILAFKALEHKNEDKRHIFEPLEDFKKLFGFKKEAKISSTAKLEDIGKSVFSNMTITSMSEDSLSSKMFDNTLDCISSTSTMSDDFLTSGMFASISNLKSSMSTVNNMNTTSLCNDTLSLIPQVSTRTQLLTDLSTKKLSESLSSLFTSKMNDITFLSTAYESEIPKNVSFLVLEPIKSEEVLKSTKQSQISSSMGSIPATISISENELVSTSQSSREDPSLYLTSYSDISLTSLPISTVEEIRHSTLDVMTNNRPVYSNVVQSSEVENTTLSYSISICKSNVESKSMTCISSPGTESSVISNSTKESESSAYISEPSTTRLDFNKEKSLQNTSKSICKLELDIEPVVLRSLLDKNTKKQTPLIKQKSESITLYISKSEVQEKSREIPDMIITESTTSSIYSMPTIDKTFTKDTVSYSENTIKPTVLFKDSQEHSELSSTDFRNQSIVETQILSSESQSCSSILIRGQSSDQANNLPKFTTIVTSIVYIIS